MLYVFEHAINVITVLAFGLKDGECLVIFHTKDATKIQWDFFDWNLQHVQLLA